MGQTLPHAGHLLPSPQVTVGESWLCNNQTSPSRKGLKYRHCISDCSVPMRGRPHLPPTGLLKTRDLRPRQLCDPRSLFPVSQHRLSSHCLVRHHRDQSLQGSEFPSLTLGILGTAVQEGPGPMAKGWESPDKISFFIFSVWQTATIPLPLTGEPVNPGPATDLVGPSAKLKWRAFVEES